MSETARAAGRRRVHGVAREARVLPWSSRAHPLAVVVNTGPSKPTVARDVQDSHVLKEADVGVNGVLRGATLQHVVAPLQTVFLACFVIVFQVVATDVAVRVFQEGFL